MLTLKGDSLGEGLVIAAQVIREGAHEYYSPETILLRIQYGGLYINYVYVIRLLVVVWDAECCTVYIYFTVITILVNMPRI